MTIRSGGRPRDPRDGRGSRPPQAHKFEPDAYATEYVPEAYEPSRRGLDRILRGRAGAGALDGLGSVDPPAGHRSLPRPLDRTGRRLRCVGSCSGVSGKNLKTMLTTSSAMSSINSMNILNASSLDGPICFSF